MNDLQAGRLEQTCPDCGRWEAAHAYCSWCSRPMTEADWYRNGVLVERHGRRPKTAPENPPSEYRDDPRAWPPEWGPWPGEQRGPRQPRTPAKQASGPDAAVSVQLTLGTAR